MVQENETLKTKDMEFDDVWLYGGIVRDDAADESGLVREDAVGESGLVRENMVGESGLVREDDASIGGITREKDSGITGILREEEGVPNVALHQEPKEESISVWDDLFGDDDFAYEKKGQFDLLKNRAEPKSSSVIELKAQSVQPQAAPVAKSDEELYEDALGILGTPDYLKGIELLEELAERDYIKAQSKLADMYRTGNRVQKDEALSRKWCLRCAENGDKTRFLDAGYLWANGYGGAKSEEEAVKWFRLAMEQGDVWAKLILGEFYRIGRGVPQNEQESEKVFQSLLTESADTLYDIGERYRKGTGTIQKSLKRAVYWYEEAAKKGSRFAKNAIGYAYYLGGNDFPQDLDKAYKWFSDMAKEGSGYAAAYLGNMYREGKGVEKDIAKAVQWYEFATKQGMFVAWQFLGDMYYSGEGVAKNLCEAARCYQEYIKSQGIDKGAKLRMAHLYCTGEGVEQNYEEALRLYREVDTLDTEARFHMGEMYLHGKAVPQDYAEAMKYFTQASEKGFGKATYMMGYMYQKGFVEFSPSEEYEAVEDLVITYYEMAAEQGYEPANKIANKFVRDTLVGYGKELFQHFFGRKK